MWKLLNNYNIFGKFFATIFMVMVISIIFNINVVLADSEVVVGEVGTVRDDYRSYYTVIGNSSSQPMTVHVKLWGGARNHGRYIEFDQTISPNTKKVFVIMCVRISTCWWDHFCYAEAPLNGTASTGTVYCTVASQEEGYPDWSNYSNNLSRYTRVDWSQVNDNQWHSELSSGGTNVRFRQVNSGGKHLAPALSHNGVRQDVIINGLLPNSTDGGMAYLTLFGEHTQNVRWGKVALVYQTKPGGTGSVTLANWTYGETPSTPVPTSATNGTSNVTYKYKGRGSTTYAESTTQPTIPGTYTITAIFAETEEYAEVMATANFSINKANNPTTFTAASGLTYGSNSNLLSVSNTQGTPYYAVGTELSSSNYDSSGSTTIPKSGGRNAGTHNVYYYIPSTTLYKEKSGSVSVTIARKNIQKTSGNYSGAYDNSPHTITLTVTEPTGSYSIYYSTTTALTSSNFTRDGSNTKPSRSDAGTTTVYWYVHTTNGNYNDISGNNKITITKISGSISYATTTVNKEYGDPPFTNPLTKVGDGTVTYSSSNSSVASVNSSTGEVTISRSGTATITATVANGTNYTYETTRASYTVSIEAPPYEGTIGGLLSIKNVTNLIDNTKAVNTRNVTLRISSFCVAGEITEMALANENARNSTIIWESYSGGTIEKEWQLSPGDGNKTVYLMLKDDMGNTTVSFQQ